MAVETFNYLNSLVAANPVVSDGLVNGDDHIRGIKLTLLNTFPNITGPVTATQDALNGAAGVYTNGASKLLSAGTYFSANATDGFQNTLAGDIDVVLQGTIAATFQRTAGVNFFKVNGGIQATGEIKGPGICPPGATMIWWDDVLPTDGLWAWANGQIITNANVVAPILLARWSNRFGGNGTTTMGLPNLCEVVPVGRWGMGGSSDRSIIASISGALKGVIANIFGSDAVTLADTQMPSHFHSASIFDQGHSHGVSGGVYGGTSIFGRPQTTAADASIPINATNVTISSATTGVRVNSSNGLDTTYSAGGGGAHNNVQPSMAVNWIIRIG